MNLAIRGIDGQIGRGRTFHNDRHPDLKADFILANPPFNISDWGGERLRDDKRWQYGVPPAGWGARVIDRLSADLRAAYPDMKGLSPRNLKYMRAFAAGWPGRAIVREVLARIPWYHHIALMEKCRTPEERLWYARQS